MKYSVKVKQVITGTFDLDIETPAIISEKVLDKAVHDRAKKNEIVTGDLSLGGTDVVTTSTVVEVWRGAVKVYPRQRTTKVSAPTKKATDGE